MSKLFAAILLTLLLASPSWATVAFGTQGAASTANATSISVAYPTSIAAGDMLVLCVMNKYPTNGPTTPSPFLLPTNGQGTGGAGSSGAGTGNVYSTMYYKVADGSETGSITVTITSGHMSIGMMGRYTTTLGSWTTPPTTANGADSVQDNAWSAASSTAPSVVAGDMVVVCTATNAQSTFTVEAMTQTGITYGGMAERIDNATSAGDDLGYKVNDFTTTGTTSSGEMTFTATVGTNNGAGASTFMVLHEVSAAAVAPQSSQGFLGAIIK